MVCSYYSTIPIKRSATYLLICQSNASLPRLHEKNGCFNIPDNVKSVSITWSKIDSSLSFWKHGGCPPFDPCKHDSEEPKYIWPSSNEWVTPCLTFDERLGLLGGQIEKPSSMMLLNSKPDTSLNGLSDTICDNPTINSSSLGA